MPQHEDVHENQPPAIPRNIYNEIMSAQRNGSLGSMPPTLPSKDTIYNQAAASDDKNPIVDEISAANNADFNALASAPSLSPSKNNKSPIKSSPVRSPARNGKRNSMIGLNRSASKLSKRKSVRQSMTTGLKRNSITVKLLSTYAKLSGETDWEYMDKQTRRTSATFATLCDKIFNQEDYDEDEEKLVDEEEKQAKEYEKLMEAERRKHEAELRARKELAKQKKRQKRRSLMSSKKLAIVIKDDDNSNSEVEIPITEDKISQPKRQSKISNANKSRAISDGGVVVDHLNDELTPDDIENIKRRSVTQPEVRQRSNPVLTRRPVSRLDPLWIAHENEELSKAKEALEAEYRSSKSKSKKAKAKAKKKVNRESVISVIDDDFDYGKRRYSRNSDFDRDYEYELPSPEMENSDLSEEYMSEIRKSRLLNSQQNIHAISKGDKQAKKRASLQRANNELAVAKQREREGMRIKSREREIKLKRELREKEDERIKEEQRKTLISDVKIPTVTRKSRHFTNSNKRLSVLTMRSTKESYRDLNSLLDASDDEYENDGKGMPNLRTSFADRLNRAGLAEEEDEEPLDEGSIMDFDEHLANKRSSYYGSNSRRYSKYSSGVNKRMSKRPASELPELPDHDESQVEDTDDTFATKDTRRKSKYSLLDGDRTDDTDVFEHIKLPEDKKKKSSTNSKSQGRKSNTKSMHPGTSMLLPDLDKLPPDAGKPRQSSKSKSQHSKYYKNQNSDTDNTFSETIPPTPPVHQGSRKPLEDSTNRLTNNQPDLPAPQKRNRSIFRKLSWGSKKTLEEPNTKANPNSELAVKEGNNSQLPSPADSRAGSVEEKKSGGFFRWLSGSNQEVITPSEIKRYHTILPKQEMSTALFALLNSWTNFGLKNLKNDTIAYYITGSISKDNAFDLKSCKFRIKINPREFNQKSEIVCARVKGSKTTTETLFKEIEKVLRKEGI
ncbi:hypothetical protein QCA50_012930 [Cerrena zonata]|uniref:non-specific serine/threonine protein kinase n=1 Tax=Cerrena zonata TaxID=2478898 RepID=A0AAW0FX31_9APHY